MKWPSDPAARRKMVEALLDWVEELDRAEPAPQGVDPAAAGDVPDLAGTLASLEALRREVGLQGRAFQRLAEHAERPEDPPPDLAAIRESGRREGMKETIGKLLDARDRLARLHEAGQNITERIAAGPFGAARRREAFGALLEALRLALESTDESLRGLDCRELRAQGCPFDPARMRAVERGDVGEGPPGTVVAVIRSGWVLGEEVVRLAEVRAVPAEAR